MDNSLVMILVGVGGVIVGFILGKLMGGSSAAPEAPEPEPVEWWKIRESLTGTQLQILEFMEQSKAATITQLQEKFSFIPDRELYYRIEQIALMNFIDRSRKDSEVVYELNGDYSMTIEEDKTVILPNA